MDGKKISREFLFYLYLFFNILLGFYFIYTGYLGGDFEDQGIITKPFLMVFSIVIVIFSFIFILKIIFPLTERIQVSPLIFTDSKFLHVIFLIVSLFYILCALLGVSNTRLDHAASDVPSIIFHLYSILSPQNIILIYCFYSFGSKNKIYFINLFLLIIGYYLSGTTFVLIYLLPLFIFYMEVKKRLPSIKKICFYSFCFLLIYPLLRVLKYGINTIFSMYGTLDERELRNFLTTRFYANGDGFFENYIDFLSLSLARFQHVANIEYLIENNKIIYQLSSHYDIWNIDFYMFRFINKLFYNTGEIYNVQNVVAYHISGFDTWASHIGFIGYGLIYGIESFGYYLFIFPLIFFSIILAKKIGGRVIELVWLNNLIMIVHGWFSPYIYFTYGLVVFVCIQLICAYKYRMD